MTRRTSSPKNSTQESITFSIGPIKISPKILIWTSIILAALLLLFFKLQSHKALKKEKQDPLVALSQPTLETVDVFLDSLGTVSAGQSITLKNQVDGILTKIHFKEGQFVKKGDLLLEIDSAPFKAQLKQYEGQLIKDKALLETAKLDLKRYEMLLKQNSVSKQIFDTQKSLVKQYEGTVQADQALVDQAKINHDYCFIKAPSDGYMGLQNVDPGNYVRSQDTTSLAILNNVDPISVSFSLPEEQLPRVLEKQQKGSQLEIFAYDRSEGKRLATTKSVVIDNQIDPTTGTIKLKGSFENGRQNLFPNQFVAIRLRVDTLHKALTIPTQAIQYGTDGTYVYCYDKNHNQVFRRLVQVGPQKGTLSVIIAGLKFEDTVVTEGIDKIKDGDKVSIASSNNESSRESSDQNSLRKNV